MHAVNTRHQLHHGNKTHRLQKVHSESNLPRQSHSRYMHAHHPDIFASNVTRAHNSASPPPQTTTARAARGALELGEESLGSRDLAASPPPPPPTTSLMKKGSHRVSDSSISYMEGGVSRTNAPTSGRSGGIPHSQEVADLDNMWIPGAPLTSYGSLLRDTHVRNHSYSESASCSQRSSQSDPHSEVSEPAINNTALSAATKPWHHRYV